jgi:hypothetical protein
MAAASYLPEIRRDPTIAGKRLAEEIRKHLPMAGGEPDDMRDLAITFAVAAERLHALHRQGR